MSDWKDSCNAVIDDWDKKRIVASPDIDGLLSAAVLCNRFGSKVVAIYTTTDVLLLGNTKPTDLIDALWLDHDISYPGVRCIGQHLILHSASDTLPLRHPVSFNPNHYFPQDYRNSFSGRTGKKRDKYPFGTIHFLMSALDIAYPQRGSKGYALFAHADGTWSNVLRYAFNCAIWIDLMFLHDLFMLDMTNSYVVDEATYRSHIALITDLLDLGISRRSSAGRGNLDHIQERWRAMSGHQKIEFRRTSDFSNYISKMNVLNSYICAEIGVDRILFDDISDILKGTVETPYPNKIPIGSFDQTMVNEAIFSHAIVSNTELRYTTGISLSTQD